MIIRHTLMTALLLTPLPASLAADYLPTGRYMEYTTSSQALPLIETIVKEQFSRRIVTVGQAINALLDGSGFRLAPPASADPTLPVLLNAPLPDAHRLITPMSLCDALTMLAGEGWVMVYDPVHRLVSFEVAGRPTAKAEVNPTPAPVMATPAKRARR